MKKICFIATWAMTISTANAGTDVIYGQDDRKDIFETSNALHLKLAKSTAGMVDKSMFVNSMKAKSFDLQDTTTLERAENVCTSEKFIDQPLAPICSGFLVGPDTLVTAGHCYKDFDRPENVCKNFAWVFDYDMKNAQHNPTKNISVKDIYGCKSISSAQMDESYDFAIIKLDRKVVGREPLKFRTTGKLTKSTSLVVIGHPTGLPTKISDKGRVTFNKEETRFSTTLDTFHGNSGSAVFDAKTGLVEGILIMGKNDYRPSIYSNPGSCKIVNKCNNSAKNCSAGAESGTVQYGEVVLRIEKIKTLISSALAIK